jgi:AcrR family transcriptional regulator
MGAEPKLSKSERTRAAILASARRLFAETGYEGASVRDIAADAAVDPALVIRYFGSKDALFAQAAEFTLGTPDLSREPGTMGEKFVRHFLRIWEGADASGGLPILLRSAASNDHAAARVRDIFVGQVLPIVSALTGAEGAAQRAGLISSQMLGLAMCRYILKLPPVVALTQEQLIKEVGRTIQSYFEYGAQAARPEA